MMPHKVTGFDGRQYSWMVAGYMIRENDIRPRSSYHLRCRALLKSIFPTLPVCEEVVLPGSGNLKLDFYLPRKNLGIEVHGEQHYQLVGKFHANRTAFLDGQRRDADKRRWCQSNNVRLIELDYRESDDEWANQVANG